MENLHVKSIQTAICQSCGVILKDAGDFGTNQNGEKNSEYCHYCYQGGKFTDEGISLKDKINKEARLNMSRQNISEKEAYKQANIIIPNLGRWQKQTSAIKSINVQKNRPKPALIIIMALILGIFFWIKNNGEKTGSNTTSSDFLFPLWFIIVMIPIFTKRKKKTEQTSNSAIKFFILFLVILMLIGSLMLMNIAGEYPSNMTMAVAILIALLMFAIIFKKRK